MTRMFGLIRGALMALAALLAAALPAAAETPSERAAALLEGLIKTNDPGLAVLVAQDGKILFESAYGLADLERHRPVIPQTTFRIGSITKQFTASAILKLEEEGKLSVNDKLSKYVPDFPRGDEVTLRNLLTHTSGIHDFTDVQDIYNRVTNATTTESLIEKMKNDAYDFNPGTKFRYDNAGYLLLGYIVEKVSGQSYESFLRAKFFQPLGMTNTGVYRAHLGLPHEALGYSLDTNGFKQALYWDPSWSGGAGALYSTVEDLYRWNEGIFNARALDAASLKAAFTPVKVTEGQVNSDTGYGFGWAVDRHRGLRIFHHGGSLPGFKSCLLRVPDEKFTVAVLANVRSDRPGADTDLLADQLAEIFLEDKLSPLPIVNTNVLPETYDALTGRYDLGTGGIVKPMTIIRRGPHLLCSVGGRPEKEIFPESTTEFFWKGGDDQITFVKDSSGKAVKLIVHENGQDLEIPRAKL